MSDDPICIGGDVSFGYRGFFDVPRSSTTARGILNGSLVSGVLSPLMLYLVYRRFLDPLLGLGVELAFLVFTAIFVPTLAVVSSVAKLSSGQTRAALKWSGPVSASAIAVASAASERPELVQLGRAYWRWQLIGVHLAGASFTWLVGVFFFFIV